MKESCTRYSSMPSQLKAQSSSLIALTLRKTPALSTALVTVLPKLIALTFGALSSFDSFASETTKTKRWRTKSSFTLYFMAASSSARITFHSCCHVLSCLLKDTLIVSVVRRYVPATAAKVLFVFLFASLS